MIRPTVWVVKEQVKQGPTGAQPMDYTPAYQFGDLKFITDIDPPLHANSTVQTLWNDQVRRFISEFDTEHDWLILTGSPLAIARIGKFLGELKSQHPVRVLVWRREQGRYVPTTL